MSQPNVTLYALSTCGHCKSTKSLLNKNDIKYDMYEVDTCPADQRGKLIDEVRKYNPATSFPTLLIGDKVIVGYREKEIKEALGI